MNVPIAPGFSLTEKRAAHFGAKRRYQSGKKDQLFPLDIRPDRPFGTTPLTNGFSGMTILTENFSRNPATALLSYHGSDVWFLSVEDRKLAKIKFENENGPTGKIQVARIDLEPQYAKSPNYYQGLEKAIIRLCRELSQKNPDGEVFLSIPEVLVDQFKQQGAQPAPTKLPASESTSRVLMVIPPRLAKKLDREPKIQQETRMAREVRHVAPVRPRRSSRSAGPPRHHVILDRTDKNTAAHWSLNHYISHGQLVLAAAKAYTPNPADTFELIDREKAGGIVSALQKILKRLEQGEKIDGLNLSYGPAVNLTSLGQKLDLPIQINRKTLDKDREWIKERFLGASTTSEEEKLILELLEEIAVKYGVNVSIAGANKGPYVFNGYLLAKGTTGVGYLDLDGEKAVNSADNALIRQFALGAFPLLPVRQKGEIIGYSIFADKKVDIPISEVEIRPFEYLDFGVSPVIPFPIYAETPEGELVLKMGSDITPEAHELALKEVKGLRAADLPGEPLDFDTFADWRDEVFVHRGTSFAAPISLTHLPDHPPKPKYKDLPAAKINVFA